MSASSEAVLAGLREPLAAAGVDVESVEVEKAGRRHIVRVVVDCDGGVDLDKIADVSRVISDLLDEPPLSDELPGPFVLEVTSPGVDRPLTETRHWRRAVSRLVRVSKTDGAELVGRIESVSEDGVVLVAVDDDAVEIPFADVRRAVVQVEFNRSDEE